MIALANVGSLQGTLGQLLQEHQELFIVLVERDLPNSNEEFVNALQVQDGADVLDYVIDVAHNIFVLPQLGFPD